MLVGGRHQGHQILDVGTSALLGLDEGVLVEGVVEHHGVDGKLALLRIITVVSWCIKGNVRDLGACLVISWEGWA